MAREEDKAMAGLLRRSLAQDAGAGEDCPGPEILAAYCDRALDAPETARYELHFSRCSLCREQLAAMTRAGGAVGGEREVASGRRNWLWEPRWVMPAAAALVAVLAVAGIVWHGRKPVAPAAPSANELAMSRPEAAPPSGSPSGSAARDFSVPPAAQKESAAPAQASATSNAAPVNGEMRKKSGERRATAGGEIRPGGAAGTRSSQQSAFAPAATPTPEGRAAGVESAHVQVAPAAPAVPPNSAMQSVTVTQAAPAEITSQNQAAAQALTDLPHTQTGSGNGVGVGEPTPEEKQASAAKAKSATGTTSAQSTSEMRFTASRAAALARMQQADISSNLAGVVVQTPDSKILWMISSAGAVSRSEDGGATWKTQMDETPARIAAGSAPTAKICWLAGASGLVLRTADGAAWTLINAPAETDLVSIVAKNELTATVTAADGRKFRTTDGGKRWTAAK